MNSETCFLPTENLACVDANAADAGSLLYMPAKGLRRFALLGIGDEGSRYLLDFGGDRPFGVWVNEQDLGPAVLISTWRLEVDPPSGIVDMYASVRVGHAYIVNGESGLIGMIQPHQRTKLAISTSGAAGTGGALNQQRAMFSRWRIVTGPVGKPAVLVNSQDLPVPIVDD